MSVADVEAHDARSGMIAMAAPFFAVSLFLSAFLLFSVQPMFTKMVLPVLGGSPSVWSVAMVFFQAMLLAGYCYAHLLQRLGAGRGALIHLALMAVALAALPIALGEAARTPPASGEALWLIGLFLASVGLPFFAVSANGPLLQAWFSRTSHPQAKDPYFLYGASNVGSFAALIAYPLLLEPMLTVSAQTRAWTIGFVLLAATIGACAWVAMRSPSGRVEERASGASPKPRAGERLAWIALAAVPSGLLVSVTQHISTDVAAAPLLWVAPLALFLLTFVLVFRDRPLVSQAKLAAAQVWLAGLTLMLIALGHRELALNLPAHVLLFFVAAMTAHSALYARRPAAEHLTEFYLYMSLGGVIGGIFAGLLAPHLFSSVIEYPLLIAAALFCAPAATGPFFTQGADAWRDAAKIAGAFAFALACVAVAVKTSGSADAGRLAAGVIVGVAVLTQWRRPERAAVAGLCGALTAAFFLPFIHPQQTFRSFFGVHKVREMGGFRTLEHGTTMHGAMRIVGDDGRPFTGRPEPTTYYTDPGPINEAIMSLRAARGGRIERAALVGLGAGALACQFKPGEVFTFYEIDPEVIRLATDPAMFRFLDSCGGADRIVLGDARLTLAKREGRSPLIVIDAFSSDAIPLHLLTREAIASYAGKIDDRGMLVFHTSNKYFELSRILARTGAEEGFIAFERTDMSEEPMTQRMRSSSQVVALVRDASHAGDLATSGRWRRIEPEAGVTPWTDDYSNILAAIAHKLAK